MTPETIAMIVGVIVALALEYIPKFKDWYNGKTDTEQKLIAIGIGLLVVEGAFGLGCLSLLAPYWPCTWAGQWLAVQAFIAFVLANQTVYALFLKKNKK